MEDRAEIRGGLLERFKSPEFRAGGTSRVASAFALGAVLLVITAIGTAAPIASVVALLVLLAGWAWIRGHVGAACVETYERGVLVRNPFSTVWIPWEDMAETSGGGRLRIERRDASAVLSYAVGNSNYGWLTGREGYADEVARKLWLMKQQQAE